MIRTISPRDPKTPDEWQVAVDGATFLLLLDAMRQYGLVTGGPHINAERCADILARGKDLGYEAAPLDELIRRSL